MKYLLLLYITTLMNKVAQLTKDEKKNKEHLQIKTQV